MLKSKKWINKYGCNMDWRSKWLTATSKGVCAERSGCRLIAAMLAATQLIALCDWSKTKVQAINTKFTNFFFYNIFFTLCSTDCKVLSYFYISACEFLLVCFILFILFVCLLNKNLKPGELDGKIPLWTAASFLWASADVPSHDKPFPECWLRHPTSAAKRRFCTQLPEIFN